MSNELSKQNVNEKDLQDFRWDEIWVLNPESMIRPDRGRAYLATRDTAGDMKRCFVHTELAIITALLNGKRTLAEVVDIIKYVFELNEEDAEKTMVNFMKSVRGWGLPLVRASDLPKNSKIKQYNPNDFACVGSRWNENKEEPKLKSPSIVTLTPTYKCATNCIYCYSAKRPVSKEAMLSFARIQELIDEMKEIGVYKVWLTGGDPMMHPRILDILELLTNAGIAFDLPTKVPMNKQQINRLASMGLKDLQFSIDGPNAEICDFMMQTPGWFERAVETIKMLIEAGIGVRTNTILTSYNIKYAEETMRFLNSLDVYRAKLTLYSRSIYHHSESFWAPKEEAEKLLENIDHLQSTCPGTEIIYNYDKDWNDYTQEEKEEKWKPTGACTAFTETLHITPDGICIPTEEMLQSEHYVLGNVTNNTIQEVWDSERFDRVRRPSRELFKRTACYTCSEYDVCHYQLGYCFRDAYKAYGTPFAPPPACPKAPKGLKLAGCV